MKHHIKEILIIIFIVLIAGGLAAALILISGIKEDSVCNKIHLSVSDYAKFKFVTCEDINSHLKKSEFYPVGKLHSEIDLVEMEHKLRELSMIKDVSCSFANNGDVNVVVTQRVPKFRVKGDGYDYYVDNNRRSMPTSIKFSAYVPVVTGIVKFDFASTELYDFIEYIDSESRWSTAFTQINVCRNKDIELIPRVGDFIIKLGQLDGYESKLKKLDRFLDVVPAYDSWNKYSVINLEFKGQVVCTKKNK